VLSCRIKGFYPFPGEPKDPVAWFFRDTHHAIFVKSSASSDSLLMDFMTEGGPAAEVWWNEQAKWWVFLGQSFPGEVRVRSSGARGLPSSKLERLREIAAGYDCRMNVYTNNCRMFCARMRREVERLNAEDAQGGGSLAEDLASDSRLAFSLLRAGALPLLYPIFLALLMYACVGL